MTIKKILQLLVVIAILVTSFASTGSSLAWSGCANYITVQWGDTLSGLAATCGTTVDAIRAANPGMGWWLYAGQVICIPTGYTSTPVNYPTYYKTYMVQWGDTLGKIAASYAVSVYDILAINPQIWNPSLIYTGQVINLPASTSSAISVVIVNSPTYPTNPSYPTTSSQSPTLKVTYGKGLLVRTGPGKDYAEIHSPLVSAVKNSEWRYGTVTTDTKGMVWAEVRLNPLVVGYSTGWILVRDHLGNYFTDPQIDR